MEIQGIGDSMIKRLDIFLKLNSPTSLEMGLTIGLSGAKIHDLKSHLKKERVKLNTTPLLIFVGTNDIFKGTGIKEMCDQYTALVKWVRKASPGIFLIIVQLPIYPRAQKITDKLEKFIVLIGILAP
jgi:hypothetical protein